MVSIPDWLRDYLIRQARSRLMQDDRPDRDKPQPREPKPAPKQPEPQPRPKPRGVVDPPGRGDPPPNPPPGGGGG